MTRSTVDQSQRTAARVIGFAYLLAMAVWLLVRGLRPPKGTEA